MGEWVRSYKVHVPKNYDADRATPVVLAYHGLGMNAKMMEGLSGLSETADRHGFIVVYPNGQGALNLRFWNAGGIRGAARFFAQDDIAFTRRALDDLATVANVDSRRVYAAGMSNGGMLCYCLASEMADRLAAVASVGGLMATEKANPSRPVPLLHFHGLEDRIVLVSGSTGHEPGDVRFYSLKETIAAWVRANGASPTAIVIRLPDTQDDGTTVVRKRYPAQVSETRRSAPVVLYEITGGGHTWPGQPSPQPALLGRSTRDIDGGDMMWRFFRILTAGRGDEERTRRIAASP